MEPVRLLEFANEIRDFLQLNSRTIGEWVGKIDRFISYLIVHGPDWIALAWTFITGVIALARTTFGI